MTKSRNTHRLVEKPTINVRYLADYMAASSQVRRTILRNCKYQPIARVIQHNEAKAVIANWLSENARDLDELREKVSGLRDRFFDDDFASAQSQHNCDYIEAFIEVYPDLDLPPAEYFSPSQKFDAVINKTTVKFAPNMLLSRITRANTVKIGGVFLRYLKGTPLNENAGKFQSSFMFGFLRENPFEPDAKPEHELCLTVDCVGGIAYKPPTDKAVYFFKEMAAECASIAERWDAIQPPPNAKY